MRIGILDPNKYTGDVNELAKAIRQLQEDSGATVSGIRFENEEAVQLAIDNQVGGTDLPRKGEGTDENGEEGAITKAQVQAVIDARAAAAA